MISQLTTKTESMEEQLHFKDGTSRSFEVLATERAQQLSSLEQECKARDEKIAKLEETLAAKAERVKEVDAKLVATMEKLTKLHEEKEQVRQQVILCAISESPSPL